MLSCLSPQNTSQRNGNVPAFDGVTRTTATRPEMFGCATYAAGRATGKTRGEHDAAQAGQRPEFPAIHCVRHALLLAG